MNPRNTLVGLLLAALVFSGCECTNGDCDLACDRYHSCPVALTDGNPCWSCNMFELDDDDPGVRCANCVLESTCEEMVVACSAVCAEAGEKWGNSPSSGGGGDDDD
jgi:hypothetical protein